MHAFLLFKNVVYYSENEQKSRKERLSNSTLKFEAKWQRKLKAIGYK